MAYEAHYRLTLSGTLGSAEPNGDIFSFGVSMTATLAQSPSMWEAAVATACTDYFGRNQTGIRTNAVLTQVKISLKGPDGKDSAPPWVVAVTKAGASMAGTVMPFQVSRVVSLGAANQQRRAKGRFYLPSPDALLDASTGHDTASQAGVCLSTQTWFADLKAASGESVIVASSKDGNHPVTTVRVGNVLDTMRSRRNKLREVYASLPVPA